MSGILCSRMVRYRSQLWKFIGTWNPSIHIYLIWWMDWQFKREISSNCTVISAHYIRQRLITNPFYSRETIADSYIKEKARDKIDEFCQKKNKLCLYWWSIKCQRCWNLSCRWWFLMVLGSPTPSRHNFSSDIQWCCAFNVGGKRICEACSSINRINQISPERTRINANERFDAFDKKKCRCLKLQLDIPKSWNSTIRMISRVLGVYRHLLNLTSKNAAFAALQDKLVMFNQMQYISKVLQPLMVMSNRM